MELAQLVYVKVLIGVRDMNLMKSVIMNRLSYQSYRHATLVNRDG